MKHLPDTKDPTKYDAFISYKHGPVDSEIAKLIQKKLETLRVKKDGISKRKIDRIFLDNGELSASPDFKKDINQALANSEWLIVICSKESVTSPWITYEVDSFLKSHNNNLNKVLPVLVSGEPSEVFPPQLDPDKVRAADIRGNNLNQLKKNFRERGIYDIAAPLLGTNFEALKQRRKAYRLRVTATLTSIIMLAAIAFAIYAYQQAEKIQIAHNSTMIEQSRRFADLASEQLTKNNVIEAIEILKPAFPKENEDWMVPAEAEKAAIDVLNLYSGPAKTLDIYQQTGTMQHLYPTDDSYNAGMAGSENDQLLFSTDTHLIYIWDASTCELKETLPIRDEFDEDYYQIYDFDKDCVDEELHSIYFIDGNYPNLAIECYDYQKDEYLWNFHPEETYGKLLSLTLFDQKVYFLSEKQIGIIDAAKGSLIQSISIPEDCPEITHSYGKELFLSANGEQLAIGIKDNIQSDETDLEFYYRDSQILLVNLSTGISRILSPAHGSIVKISFCDENNLLIVTQKGLTANYSSNYTSTSTYYGGEFNILKYNPDNGIQWSHSFDYQPGYDMDTAVIKYPDPAHALIPFHNQLLRIKVETGEVLDHWQFLDSLVFMRYNENGTCNLTKNGQLIFTNFGDTTWSSRNEFPDQIEDCVTLDDNVYLILDEKQREYNYTNSKRGNKIRKYNMDADFDMTLLKTPLKSVSTIGLPTIYNQNGYFLFLDDYTYASEFPEVLGFLYDGHKDQMIGIQNPFAPDCSITLNETFLIESHQKIIRVNFTDSCSYKDHSCYGVLEIEVETGKTKLTYYPDLIKNIPSMVYDVKLFDGESFYLFADEYPDDSNHICSLFQYDIENKEQTLLGSSEQNGITDSLVRWSKLVPYQKKKGLILESVVNDNDDSNYTYHILLADFSKIEIKPLIKDIFETEDSTLSSSLTIKWSEDGTKIVIIKSDQLLVYQDNGTLLTKLEFAENKGICDASITEDGKYLLVITSNGYLLQYDLESGDLFRQSSLDNNLHFTSFEECNWNYQDQQQVMITDYFLNTTIIYDYSEKVGGIRAIVSDATGYDETLDRFWCFHDGLFVDQATSFGWYHHYSLGEITKFLQEK